ncbi:hypothetical protein FRC08_007937 [Ceratobasidium sp. 394]|nr:hypothetical protein FRC08_007937 [Ceratobasidium sp. 394]
MAPLAIRVPSKLAGGTRELRAPASVADILQAIDESHDSDAESLHISGVTEQLFTDFDETWSERGRIRIRYSWDGPAQRLTVTMITPLHETIAGFVSDAVPTIRANLANVLMCDEIVVGFGGVHDCPAKKRRGESKNMQPDASIQVAVGGAMYDPTGKCPTVVAEMMYSQNKAQGLDKCRRWLWETAAPLQVQAVIVYEMGYPLGEEGTLRATLSVWVRDTDVREVRYPLHDCRADVGEGPRLGKAARKSLRAPLNEETREEHFWPPGENDNKIRTRGGYVTVIDETSNEQWTEEDHLLVLRAFDFARFCPAVLWRGSIPQDHSFNVSVAALRASTLRHVSCMRRKVEEKKPAYSPQSVRTESSTNTLALSWADICGTSSEESEEGEFGE